VAAAHRRLTDAQAARPAGLAPRDSAGAAAAPRSEMGSLRSSLLKKPLSSLIKD